MAIIIGKKEGADIFVVQLAALLHDIGDWKYHDDENAGADITHKWLSSLGIDANTVLSICEIVNNVSYKGSEVPNKIKTLEGFVVQDADRLDALGAIGIARVFTTSHKMGNPIHDPNLKPIKHTSFEQYKSSKSTAINHFYEKLLLLKEEMNTDTAKQLAKSRHEFMLLYLEEFFKEWEGKDVYEKIQGSSGTARKNS